MVDEGPTVACSSESTAAIRLHYSRGGRHVSLRRAKLFFIRRTGAALLGLLAVLPAAAQYPGTIDQKAKQAPVLRAVAVLEWTGPAGKPKFSRLIPITIYDGNTLQDAGVYLARPQPLAVDGGTEYFLEKNGRRVGRFDIQGAGQVQGSWVGLGAWKPMPKPKTPPAEFAMNQFDDPDSDRPVLHRKIHPGEAPVGGAAGKSAPSRPPAPPPDPDRPTLKRTADESASAGDTGRPTLQKPSSRKSADVGYVESVTRLTDPGRPRLLRGKSDQNGPSLTPTLMGMPKDVEQMVAVSDAQNRPEHPWSFQWANPADELKMKADIEDAARAALGLNAPPPAPAPAPRRKGSKAKATPPPPPPEPAPLEGEMFRVFQLAYGSGATLVLTAHTGGPVEQQKYVTLIGQPDLYGSLLVLFKSVTDSAHLDVTPRMRLIDAVDALGDNRGELLFELHGVHQRQFALYRVLRGTVERLFVTGGGEFGDAGAE